LRNIKIVAAQDHNTDPGHAPRVPLGLCIQAV
jgi:hypothetical protein